MFEEPSPEMLPTPLPAVTFPILYEFSIVALCVTPAIPPANTDLATTFPTLYELFIYPFILHPTIPPA